MKIGTAKQNKLVIFLFGVFLLSLAGCNSDSSSSSSAATWGTAEVIDHNNLGDTMDPQIAIDESGNAVAIWLEFDGIEWNLWGSEYNGSTWGTAELIGTDTPLNTNYPRVAMDGDGNAIAVWQRSDAGSGQIWANRFDAISGWSGAVQIDFGTDYANSPQIAFDADGNAFVVCNQGSDITAIRYNAATPGWEAAQVIESEGSIAESPQVAFDSNGNAMAVWKQHDGLHYSIWANRFNASTKLWMTAAETIETQNIDARDPQIAIDGSGNAVVTWVQGGIAVWANRYDATEGWQTAESIGNALLGDSWGLRLAADAGGNAVAVWYQYEDDIVRHEDIWANRYDANTGWGTAKLLETGDGNAEYPQIAMDGEGNAIAVWRQYDQDLYLHTIESLRFDAKSLTWSAPERIQADFSGSAGDPQIAMNAAGNAIAVWEQQEQEVPGGPEGIWNIWANHFE